MTDTETTAAPAPEPAPAAEDLRVPAHRAGAGVPAPALQAARNAGWLMTHDEHGNARAESPDGELELAYRPEVYPGPLWIIGCTAHPQWMITADTDTPAEFIAALITAITTAAPLEPGRWR